MKIKCPQHNLVQGINIAQKAVSGKTTIPILKGLLIEAYDQTVKITGNDLEIGIETTISADIIEEGSFVVDSRLFGEIIKKLPDDEIFISVNEEYQIDIECKNSNFKLIGFNPEEFTKLPEIEEDMCYDIPIDLLKNMIRQTVFAISQDESRPVLMGELMEVDENKINLVALDGYRLAIKGGEISNTIGNHKMIIPGKTLQELNRLIGNETEGTLKIAFTEKHALFITEDTKMTTRLLEGEFLNYSQILPKEYGLRVKAKTKSILNSLERAALMAREGKNNLVKFNITDDILTITSNSDIGNVKEVIDIELEGNDLEIAFNSRYFIEALKVIDTEDIYMEFNTSVSPCVVRPGDFSDYVYLLLPVRISAD